MNRIQRKCYKLAIKERDYNMVEVIRGNQSSCINVYRYYKDLLKEVKSYKDIEERESKWEERVILQEGTQEELEEGIALYYRYYKRDRDRTDVLFLF